MSSALMVLSLILVLVLILPLIPVLALISTLALIIRHHCLFFGQGCDAFPDLPHGHSPYVLRRNVRVELS